MTTITIDLADILEAKFQHGVRVPACIEVGDLIEAADDDWAETLDLDQLLAERHEAALVFSAAAVRRLRPHLTDEQAWEVVEVTRDQTRHALDDFLGDVADETYPSAKCQLRRRAVGLKLRLESERCRHPDAAGLVQQLAGLERLIQKLPDGADGNPAFAGGIAAALDDVEQAVAGGPRPDPREGRP